MGRKKLDKSTLEYMIPHLFHKENLTGFQFTAGNTPLGITENRPLDLTAHLIFNEQKGNVVIDGLEWSVRDKIMEEVFSVKEFEIDKQGIKKLQEQFKKLGYEVEEADFAGYWYWFRVKCTPETLIEHVNNLKTNLKLV